MNKEMCVYVQKILNRSAGKTSPKQKEYNSSLLSLKKNLGAGTKKLELEALRKTAVGHYNGLPRRNNYPVITQMFINLKHQIEAASDLK